MNEIAVENKLQLGQVLQARGIVTAEQVSGALAEQKEKGRFFLKQRMLSLN